MDAAFQEIITHIMTDYGIAAFDKQARYKALLSDYAKGVFKKERRLLLQVLEAGCHRKILESQELPITRKILIRDLQDDYYITQGAAEDVVDLLIRLLRPAERVKPVSTIPDADAMTKKPPLVSIPDNFVHIPGGTFMMGSPASEAERRDNEVRHQVTVSSFFMGKYEVTHKEYQAVMGTNPSYFEGDNLPVEQVSWFDAVEYCNARSRTEGLTPAYTISGMVTWNRNANGYRLPTEAEWEYACRGGTTTAFSTGSNITTNQANYNGYYPYNRNATGTYRRTTTPVGSFMANARGLYDMHGNVWEWCWDWYDDYGSGFQRDPVGASSGTYRVLRGGGWGDGGQLLRSADRYGYSPFDWNSDLGFRLLRPSL